MKKFEKYINMLVNLGMVFTILLGLGFPLIYNAFIKTILNSGISLDKYLVLNLGYLCFYILYVPYLFFIYKLRGISKILSKEDYFNIKIAKNLNIMGKTMILIGVLYVAINIFLFYKYDLYLYALTIIPVIIIPFVAITLGLLFIFSGELYSNIIEIKEENDLTI